MKVALGLGCDRDTPEATLADAVDRALAELGTPASEPVRVVGAGSITLKADEPGLLALARARGWSLRFYPPEVLAQVRVPNPSETVRRHTGTPSVSEAAALLTALASDPASLRVEKLRWRGADGRSATVSVAVADDAQQPCFDSVQRDDAQALLAARRDMRHFLPGCRVDDSVIDRLLAAVQAAPSVGLMQPWRLLRITDGALREQLAREVDAERLRTAAQMGPREAEFLALKVAGVHESAELWALVLAPDDGTLFGRRTLPRDMAVCSAGAAVQNLWLAARAENLGLGWVSLFEPAVLAQALQLPPGAQALGLLCLGPVAAFYPRPMLSQTGWRQPRPHTAWWGENHWAFEADSPSVSADPGAPA